MRRLLAAIAALCFGGVLAIAGGYSPAGVTSAAYCPTGRTVTVNGVAGSLETNLSFTVTAGMCGTDLAYTNVTTLTSAAIQGAIDALASTYGAGRINLTRGTYVMAAGGINISNNVQLVGSGWGTILDSTGQQQTDDVIDIAGANVAIRSLKIVSDRDGGTAFSQINVEGLSTDYIIENVHLFTSDDDAICTGSTAHRGLIKGCYIYNPDQYGICVNGYETKVDSCHIEDADFYGISLANNSKVNNSIVKGGQSIGIFLGLGAGATGCESLNNQSHGIQCNGEFSYAAGCCIKDNVQDGIAMVGDFSSVAGCTFDEGGGNGKDDILLIGVTCGSVVGCTFDGDSGEAETAVHLDNSDNCSIVGNTTEGHDTCGIQIDADCDGNLVGGNNTKGETTSLINNQPTAPDSYQVGRNIYSDNSGDAHDATADGMNDDRYNGDLLIGLNAGENISQWDVVYVDSSDGEYHQADADAAGEYPVRGFAVSAGTDGNPLTIIDKGVIRNDDWDWYASSVGKELYLSDTAGGITTNAQTDAGDCGQVVGWVLSDDEIRVNVSPDYFIQESP